MSWRTCVVVKQIQSNPISGYDIGDTAGKPRSASWPVENKENQL